MTLHSGSAASSSPVAGGEAPSWLRSATDAALVLHAAAIPVSIALAQLSMGLVAVSMVARLAYARERRLLADPLAALIVLFVALKALSAALADEPGSGFRAMLGDWTVLFYLISRQAIRTPARARRLMVVFSAACAVAGLYGVIQFFAGWEFARSMRLMPYGSGHLATGFFSHHLTYGGVLVLGISTAFALACLTRGRSRLWFSVACVAIGAGLLSSFARTAWLGSIAALATAGFLVGRKALWGLAGAVGAGAVAFALRPDLRERAAAIPGILDLPRARLWLTALRITADHPFFGAGPGTYERLFPIYKVPGEYDAATGHPHNDLLNQLVQVGVVGAAAWSLIWVRFLVLAGSAWRRSRDDARVDRAVVAAAVAAVAGFLVGGLGQCYFTDEEVVMGVWLLVACGVCAASQREGAGSSSVPSREGGDRV